MVMITLLQATAVKAMLQFRLLFEFISVYIKPYTNPRSIWRGKTVSSEFRSSCGFRLPEDLATLLPKDKGERG